MEKRIKLGTPWYKSNTPRRLFVVVVVVVAVVVLWLWSCSLAITSSGRVGLCFVWFYVQEHPKAHLQFIAKAYTCNTHSHCVKNLFEKSIN